MAVEAGRSTGSLGVIDGDVSLLQAARDVSVETLWAAFCEESVVTLVWAGLGQQIHRTC